MYAILTWAPRANDGVAAFGGLVGCVMSQTRFISPLCGPIYGDKCLYHGSDSAPFCLSPLVSTLVERRDVDVEARHTESFDA